MRKNSATPSQNLETEIRRTTLQTIVSLAYLLSKHQSFQLSSPVFDKALTVPAL